MRGLIRQRPVTSIALAAFVSVLIGVAIGQADDSDGDDGDNDSAPTAVEETEPEEEPEPEPEPASEPDPDGRFSLNCDYLLGEGLDDNNFVAGGRLTNTGNIGIVVRVEIAWEQLGAEPITHEERVRIRHGDSERIAVDIPADSDMIDRHQSADSECDFDVTIVDTFGQPEEE